MFCGLLAVIPSKAVYADNINAGSNGNGNVSGDGGIVAAGYYVCIYEEANNYKSKGSADVEIGEGLGSAGQMKAQWSKYFVDRDWNLDWSAKQMKLNKGFIVMDNPDIANECNNGHKLYAYKGNSHTLKIPVYYANPNAATPQLSGGVLDQSMGKTTNPLEAYQHTGSYHNPSFDKELRSAIMDNAHTASKLNGYINGAQPGLSWQRYMQLLYSVYVSSGYEGHDDGAQCTSLINYLRNTNRNGSDSFQVIVISSVVAMRQGSDYVWYTAPEFYECLTGVRGACSATKDFKSKGNWFNTTTSFSKDYMKNDMVNWGAQLRSKGKFRDYDPSFYNSQSYWQPAFIHADGSTTFGTSTNYNWRYTMYPTGLYGKDGGNSGYTFIASKVEEGPLAASYGLYLQTTPKNKPFDTTMGGSTEATSKITFPSTADQISQIQLAYDRAGQDSTGQVVLYFSNAGYENMSDTSGSCIDGEPFLKKMWPGVTIPNISLKK